MGKIFKFHLIITFLLFVYSCRTNDTEANNLKSGAAIIKINMKGSAFEPKNINKSAVLSPMIGGVHQGGMQVLQVPFNEKYSITATLIPDTPTINKEASIKDLRAATFKTQNNLPNGIKYRVVVYNTNGSFADQKVYTTGNSIPDDGIDLKLNGGSTYKFVVYSYNNAEAPAAVNPSDNITAVLAIPRNKDFMYFITEKGISGQETNYLDVVMKHRYSQINVTLNTEAVGAASAISANVTPHQENNSFNLSDGTITYDTTAKEIPITFSGLNSTTLTGPVVISSPAITNGQFTISSITVGGVTKNNLTFKGLSITPGVKYNLNLTITAGFEIKNIEAGLYHSILLTKSGGIYVAGIGTNGQLGLNSNGIIYNTFQKVTTNIENIVPKSVDAGFEQSYIVTESGDLYATGRNDYGQLGLGDTKKRNVFTYVPFGGGSIKKFYVGVVHNFFLTHSGELYGFGANDSGQLGLGDRKNRHIPTKIPFFNDKPIKKIVSGERHSLVLTESGEVYTAGHNDYGQMGNITSVGGFKTSWVKIPLNEAVIKDIGAGTLTSHVLTESGELYGAGNNNFGQLGIGNNSNKSDFTLITNVPASIDEVVEFRDHTVLVTASGELYATGRNDYGQLGLGDTSNRNVFTHVSLTFPVKEVHPAASFNTFIKSASGMFYATGDNDRGHLGLGDNNNRKVFTPLTMN